MERLSNLVVRKNLKLRKLGLHYLLVLVSFVFYLYPRFAYRESIFFNFDMPRVALIAQDYLKNGTFMTSQYFMNESVWHNVPWGPSLIFYYSFLLNLSPDPLVVANMQTIIHFVGLVLVIVIGWKYFSPSVGVISGLLFSTQPYWITYSRLIYQPAPLVSFIVLSIYLLFSAVKDRNKITLALLPVSWVVLFQIYIPTYIFILISMVFLTINFKKLSVKYFLVGVVVSIFLLLPSISFYFDNREYIERFFNAPENFRPQESNVYDRLVNVSRSFLNITSGGMFSWQTGYGNDDFIRVFPHQTTLNKFVVSIYTLSLIYFLLKLLTKRINKYQIAILLFSISTLLSLLVLWTDELVPRYFLISLFPSILVLAISLNDLMIYLSKLNLKYNFIFLIPLSVSLYWLTFYAHFDTFIGSYSYPNGMMVDVSQTPYLKFKSALDHVLVSAKVDGCETFSISNYYGNYHFDLWMETRYVWDYIYRMDYPPEDEVPQSCRYYLTHEVDAIKNNVRNYKKISLYAVFKN